MQSYREAFEGKNITLMGLGLLGRGVGDAEFLAACGARVLVTDKKTEKQLAQPVAKLKRYSNITFHLGGHRVEDFTSCDLVIKAAGVPLDSAEIAATRAAHVPVAMSTALFAKYAMEGGAKIVGVTGTRGKSTIAHMIFHALTRAGRHAHLGGNVRGISTLAMLPHIEAGDTCVLELDSWQLQGFGDLEISPQVAVFTNLMPDHMNYYGDDMDVYFSDKANIFRHQKADGTLFVGESILERVKAMRPPAAPALAQPIPEDWELKIIGHHNRSNASFAAAALKVLGLSDKEIKQGLESFDAVEGRLQFVREVNGVKIYNDNNATTPEATIAALRALGKNITLIAGGSEKNLALDGLVSEIQKSVSRVILLVHPDYKGSERFAEVLRAAGVTYQEAEDLSTAVRSALNIGKENSVLFSPGFASFGMFKNEYERGDEFLKLVNSLT